MTARSCRRNYVSCLRAPATWRDGRPPGASARSFLGSGTFTGSTRYCVSFRGHRLAVFPNFVFHQRGDAAIWIDRNFVEPDFLERLTDADGLFAESNCQIIKDQRKVKIGRLSLAIAGQPCSLFVKRYNAFSLRYTLASPFMRSGAIRSLQGAAILRTAQIASARPLAAVENRRGGALTKSFFVSEEITGGRTVDAYWRNQLVGVKGHEGIVR